MEPALGREVGYVLVNGVCDLALLCRVAGVVSSSDVPLASRRLSTRVRARSSARCRFRFGGNTAKWTGCGLLFAGERFLFLYALEVFFVLLVKSGIAKELREVGAPRCVDLQGVIRPVLKHGPRSPYTCASMRVPNLYAE